MPGDWSGRGEAWARRARGEYYGSSDEYLAFLRRKYPHLLIPEREIVPISRGERVFGWDRDDERLTLDRHGNGRCPACSGAITRCPRRGEPPVFALIQIGVPSRVECGKCGGAIERGSHLYCPRCFASGFEFEASRQIEQVGYPPPDPDSPPEVERTAAGAIPLPGPSSSKPTRRGSAESRSRCHAPPPSAGVRPVRREKRAAQFGRREPQKG